MTLRRKIVIFTASFLATVMVVAGGSYRIFTTLGENLDLLSSEVSKHKQHDELSLALRNVVSSAESWVATGNASHRDRLLAGIAQVQGFEGQLEHIYGGRAEVRAIRSDLEGMVHNARNISEIADPVGNREAEASLGYLKAYEDWLLDRTSDLHRDSMKLTYDLSRASEREKAKVTFYLALIVAFALTSTAFLLIVMKRVLERPYAEMLKATEKVASGDLEYRIRSRAKDEFGLISSRFDDMVESLGHSDRELKRKLQETELYLSVARISGTLADRKGVLDLMTETIAKKMGKDICAILLFRVDKGGFYIESCNVKEPVSDRFLKAESGLARTLCETMKPVIIDQAEDFPEVASLCAHTASWLAVPILREQSCVGILILAMKEAMGFREDEKDAAMILSHTIGAAIRNTELYEETRKQLRQLGIVYELSKTLTSVYEPEEVLRTMSARIAGLLNARGCVIRTMDGDRLRIRSSYGPADVYEWEQEVSVGRGIAGWVAREGRPLFVEDISTMPQEIRQAGEKANSAIGVPLKKDGQIIGTLVLYDRLADGGKTASFTQDDLALAEGMASISAVAIEKLRMEELEKKTRAEIIEAKRRMELLFESVQGGIVTLDRSFSIIAANQYAERWIDVPHRELIGSNAFEVFHEKGGICPHCAAKATFEDGSINTITQSSGLNYADLASYPVKDEDGNVVEAVVFIQDITERVLYQEEIMGLYREVMQTKEYMESLINNSADAIVTSDLEGVVKSWNPAAESIYGFTKEEVVGKYLPFIPESLRELEKDNIEKIKAGEVLKLETFRRRKDGVTIEVSLTLSPIKDVTGEIIGISGISRDISDKKRVENELIRRNQELSRLFLISSAMRGTLELDRLLRMVLTAVTMGDGLGFNRAILFLVDEETGTLRGTMGVGPSSAEEAWKIWGDLSLERRVLPDIMRKIEEEPETAESFLHRLSTGIEIPLGDDTILTKTAREKKSFNIPDVKAEPYADILLIQQLGTESFATVPLVSRDNVIGVLWVDNKFNRKPVTEEDMKFLAGFANQVASAIEAARLFRKVSLAEAELENIFRSISDMVFFTDRDYTVKNVNRAVEDRLGKPREDIVGRKCYEVFHGMSEPWQKCPHHKTMETMRHYVEEFEDLHMSGTFITSTAPMFDAEGRFQGTVHVARDITEIKDLRVKLQSAERMAALGEVAAKVAHEIRNPLVSIGGFAKRLEEKLDGSLREYAHIILEEVKRLESILRGILGFVKEVRLSRRLVDLNAIVQGVLDLLGAEFQNRGNQVSEELCRAPVVMMVDPDRMKEAIFNIISNANQATDGGVIGIKTYMQNGSGVVEISDTGYGIRREDLERIFDPFFTTRPTGTGLGLAISKRIVEENQGTIEVDSKGPGQGTRFTIHLPLQEE